MFHQNKKLEFAYFTATIILSSVAYYFSTGIYNCWFLTWFGPIPLFVYALERPVLPAIFASMISYFIGFSSSIVAYSTTIISLSIFIYGAIINAAVFTILLLLFRYLALRKQHWIWSFIFASGWTAFEFLTSQYSLGGSFDSIAYTQILNLPIAQIASITGIWGITFLLFNVPACIALAWHYRKRSRLCLQTVTLPVIIVIMTILLGLYRLWLPSDGEHIKIGMASIGLSRQELLSRGEEQKAELIIGRYLNCIEQLSHSGAEIILLPEKIISFDVNKQARFLQIMAEAARKNHVTVIAGLDTRDDPNIFNSAYIFTPSGGIESKYDKQHLLPFSEGNYISGQELLIRNFEDNQGKFGIAICKDMDFENPSRKYGQNEISILFVPALDFKVDDFLHARIAIMRGIEGNYAVVRAAQWGLLSVSNNKGEIINMISSQSETKDVLLLSDIHLDNGKESVYSRFGNWFGYFSEVFFVLGVLIGIMTIRITK